MSSMYAPSGRLDLGDFEDSAELAIRIQELMNARWVRTRELLPAIGMTERDFRQKQLARIPFTRDEVERIAHALEAPPGWPDDVPGVLPSEPVALSAHLTPEEEAKNARIRPIVRAALEEFEDVIAALQQGDLDLALDAMTRARRIAGTVTSDIELDDEDSEAEDEDG